MPDDFQGEQVAVGLTLPEHPLGYLLLLALFLLLGYVVYTFRGEFGRLQRRQWLAVFGLCAAAALTALVASPLPLFEPVDPTPLVSPFRTFITPVGSIAWLLAAATLNPAAALIVGFVNRFK